MHRGPVRFKYTQTDGINIQESANGNYSFTVHRLKEMECIFQRSKGIGWVKECLVLGTKTYLMDWLILYG